jgi:UDP:flavonoid glycosyltransferase YjiC (YdhE family)
LRTLLAGAAALPATVVATTGYDLDPWEIWPEPPASILLVRSLPLSEVLQRSDLVLTAGGFYTMVSAICAGRPQLVLSLGSNQPHSASRVVELGVGRRIDLSEVSADRVTSELQMLLTKPGYGVRAARYSELNRQLPSPAEAVARLEQLAQDGKPQPAAVAYMA